MSVIIPVRATTQIAEVERLARAIWTEHYEPIIGREQVEYMLRHFQSAEAIAEQIARGHEYFLATDGQVAVGYFALLPDQTGTSLQISKIYVDRARRGHGFGRRMLEFIEALGRERDVETLWLTVNRHNRDSIDWYLRSGFVNTGTIVQDISGGFVMDDFRMEKSLTKSGSQT